MISQKEPSVLQIAPEKVAHVIIRARQFDAEVAPWDADRGSQADSFLEQAPREATSGELKSFIDDLNEDEQVALVALMWIGRGTYEGGDLDEALSTARSERVNKTSTYLMGVPLLADYLEEGLEKLGYSVEDAESGIL